jgi:hypothetical protein
MGSYAAWCRVVRRAVYWTTGLDPCRTRETARAADDVASQLPGLLQGWDSLCQDEGKDGLTSAAAFQALDAHPDRHAELRDILLEWSLDGKLPSSRIVSNHLNKIRGRASHGKVLDYRTLDGNRRWYVRPIGPTTGSGSRGSSDSSSPPRRWCMEGTCDRTGRSLTASQRIMPQSARSAASPGGS